MQCPKCKNKSIHIEDVDTAPPSTPYSEIHVIIACKACDYEGLASVDIDELDFVEKTPAK